jgi:predicted DNA-binding transcriptional regulator AlpA
MTIGSFIFSAPFDDPPYGRKVMKTTNVGSAKPASLIKRDEVAKYLGVSLSWLDKSRLTGTGPKFIKIGNRILYDLKDLDEFKARNRHQSTSEYGLEESDRGDDRR